MALGARSCCATARPRATMPLRGLLPRLHEEPAAAGRVRRRRCACRCRRRRSSCAPTRSASASTATSRRCAPALALELDGDTVRERALGLRRHGRHRQARRAAPRRRCSASPGPRPRLQRGDARAGRTTSRRCPTCAPAPTTGARWRENLLQRLWLETRPTQPLAAAPACGRAADGQHLTREACAMNQITDAPVRRSRAAGAAWSAATMRTNRRTCTWPAAPPTSTTCPNWPARCMRRWACRRVAHGRLKGIDLDALRALPGVVDVLTADRHPRRQRLRPDRARRPDPGRRRRVHYLGQPVFAVIASTPRRGAPRRRAGARRSLRHRAAAGGADGARGACGAGQYVVPPMHLRASRARRAAARHRRRAAPPAAAASMLGGQEQFYLEGQISYAVPLEDGGMRVHCSTQHPSEMQHLVAHALGIAGAPVQVECRRMGGGFGGKESQSALFACVAAVAARAAEPAGQAAPGPRRRLPDHRPAPRLRVRLRGRLRRRRPHPRRRGRRWSRNAGHFGRPVGRR